MIFLPARLVLKMHFDNIERFGGAHGIRDEGAFESALFAPQNRANYENADVYQCAATYGFHLSQAHAFIDGNKRVAAAATLIFLGLNGIDFTGTSQMVAETFLKLAASEMTRDELEAFLRVNTVPRS